ncbi:MBL fold metallo-hydrolase [Sphaerochaeta globosa]|uniref:Beta-lactamase domain protein n=1 Tax=Sphaerochaeta globosa (strain ATCC BAA-1886 / DSM 22777 / Buddy) TaxID=158189 RepID=F0RRR7_SPHGB|nr:MBL fold metallo-hydrolase [Sphaerochaeta globosa]ADY14248.1 beta-lactamase domain protein [Sphaerochaeta globosa str. Buddy]
MSKGIEIIDVGGVNCYLIEADDDFVLIDTGFSTKRMFLDEVLKKAINKPGEVPKKLKLVILTHGDSDHAGNCKFLKENYGAKIAMHFEDSKMVENGDMSWNRKSKPDKISFTFRLVTLAFGKNSAFGTFKPDIYLQEGQNLSKFGLSAKVIHLPGHSKGSIGVLTNEGDLFCGDLIYNFAGFKYIDNLEDFNKSIDKLKKLDINILYPGHGKPFSISNFYRKVNKK